MSHDPKDEFVQVQFQAPRRLVDAINKAAARRLINRASFVRMAALQALEDDGITVMDPAG